MKDNRNARFSELFKETYENLITDLGIWVENLVAKLNGEPAPVYIAAEQKSSRGNSKHREETAADSTTAELSENDMLTVERQDIADWLKGVKFRTKLFAGVDEVDVWKKIGQLNRLYDKALLAERARYDALIRQHIETVNAPETNGAESKECEVEDGDSQERKQLDSRKDNIETTAEGCDEAGVYQPVSESSGDSAGGVSDPVAGVPDNAGAGEQYVSGDKGRRPDDKLQVRARVRKG